MSPGRLWIGLTAALVLVAFALVVFGYREAVSEPLVRRLNLRVSDYPAGERPLRIALFSDVHVHGPDMPPARVAKIVREINALQPDLVIAAGDFDGDNWIGARYPVDAAIAPLSALRARLGVYAVLGNNDYDAGADEIVQALRNAGIHVLRGQVMAVGPFAIGGIDGRIYGSTDAWQAAGRRVYAALGRTPGIKILVAHRPDEFVPAPSFVTLVLAGHTHCGQIALPIIGPLVTGSDYGRKYACGVFREGSKVLVVTGGVGTSHIPLRIGAPPDIWLISIGGPASHG